ncbi:hypothetical protein PYK79_48175 [Streptomyces sp. ID05-04B]|uniref:hypothetical protein n=1 Tax=Streptomyces sp. ID05-04B TaxID=3028661 RepID=UPI0029C51E59|nr:hypothetical protein [Streptomyces sp. ID05-04B]MDX5569484.1 hypothetical protein [Streptomyces sp. ID05-04B]
MLQKPDGYRDYDRKVPLLATTLKLLAEHGPHGSVWWRYGHSAWEPLTDALANPDDFGLYSVRADARREVQEAERERARREQEERHRRLEAAKWVGPTCQRYVYDASGSAVAATRPTPGGDRRVLGGLGVRARFSTRCAGSLHAAGPPLTVVRVRAPGRRVQKRSHARSTAPGSSRGVGASGWSGGVASGR